MKKPDIATDSHLTYLDALRESGECNMFGASPYLQQEFEMGQKESIKILKYWMETFDERHDPETGDTP